MNADPDNQQDELQKMLALKRHEIPPPRFFSKFSEKVIHGLNLPQASAPPTFWQRLGLDIDSRPVLVCAGGVAVCALLGAAVILSLQVPPPKAAPRSPDGPSHLVVAPPPTTGPLSEGEPAQAPVPVPGRALHLDQPVIVPASSPLTALKTEPAAAPSTPSGQDGKKQEPATQDR